MDIVRFDYRDKRNRLKFVLGQQKFLSIFSDSGYSRSDIEFKSNLINLIYQLERNSDLIQTWRDLVEI